MTTQEIRLAEVDHDVFPQKGYCVHGKYVGGVGRDILCGPCEDGATIPVVVKVTEVRTAHGVLGAYTRDVPAHMMKLVEDYPDHFWTEKSERHAWVAPEDLEEIGLA